jgi:preprotein translocase subunit SecA
MTRIGIQDGEVIQHPMITKSVERAQKKVEENNFAIRKRLLEYDDTMNQQREVIYARRQKALQGDRLKSEIFDLLEEWVDELVQKYFDDVNVQAIKDELLQHLLVDVSIYPEEFETLGKDGLKEKIVNEAKIFYNRKEEMIGPEMMAQLERFAMLSVIDSKWKEHLREMDDVKEGINLRAYGQKDPLVEYKTEAFKLFLNLLESVRNDTVSFVFRFWPQTREEVQQRRRQSSGNLSQIKQDTDNLGLAIPTLQQSREASGGKLQPVRVEERVGRNDPCPCGSGKKYKQCHGK